MSSYEGRSFDSDSLIFGLFIGGIALKFSEPDKLD
jgi:hypothetical protein